jgi:hypothetical protein
MRETHRVAGDRDNIVAFIQERGRSFPTSTSVMIQLVDHLYARSGLRFSTWFDGLKGVRFGRALRNGRKQSFTTLYPGKPSLQFPTHRQMFEGARLSLMNPKSAKSIYTLRVPEGADPDAYLAEAVALARFAFSAAVHGKGDDPQSSAVTARLIEPPDLRQPRVTPFTPRLEPITTAPADPFLRDPVAVDRGNEAHRQTIEKLWTFLRNHGTETFTVKPGPDADLVWERDGVLFVTEAKSLTSTNQDGQLRLGIGQVLDYREQYREMGLWDSIQAVLLVESAPRSRRWEGVCAANDVILAWPDELTRVLEAERKA